MLAVAAFVIATAFLTSEALAQWSDGGPEMFPLTYSPNTATVEKPSGAAGARDDTARTFEVLVQWSDGGPEMFPLMYRPETVRVKSDLKRITVPCDIDRAYEALARWSDGGPERYPVVYPPETAAMEDKICLKSRAETEAPDRLAMR
jgi:hypothetical protein